MRRSFVILAAGGALLLAGFIIIIVSTISIIQAGDENAFFMALMDVNPLGQESTSFDISDASEPFYIVTSRVDENQLFPPEVIVEARVVDPGGETIVSDGDILQGFTMVEPTVAGTYTLYLTNTHSNEGVRLLITLTSGFLPTTETEKESIAGGLIAGTSIVIAATFVIVVGAALFLNERRKSKNKGASIVT